MELIVLIGMVAVIAFGIYLVIDGQRGQRSHIEWNRQREYNLRHNISCEHDYVVAHDSCPGPTAHDVLAADHPKWHRAEPLGPEYGGGHYAPNPSCPRCKEEGWA